MTIRERIARVAASAMDKPRSLQGRLFTPQLRRWADSLPQPATIDLLGASRTVYIAPANWAGQAYLWARALETNLPDTQAVNMSSGGQAYNFATDIDVAPAVYNLSARWHAREAEYLLAFTHVLIEASRPIFGERYRYDAYAEARVLRERGLKVGMICHGHDIRLPSRDIGSNPWSPYLDDPRRDDFEREARNNRRELDKLEAPVFVSTPDLLLDVPYASWLPLVVDTQRWTSQVGIGDSKRLRVVHAPSSARLKGSALISSAMDRLEAAGLIEFTLASGLPSEQMPGLYGAADVVLDQFRVGSYGVAAVEAMAAGRIVVGHVTEQVRSHVRDVTGLTLPIVEATVDSIFEVINGIAHDPARFSHLGDEGARYAQKVHGGAASADVLSAFLNG